jgi:hypothetical protein
MLDAELRAVLGSLQKEGLLRVQDMDHMVRWLLDTVGEGQQPTTREHLLDGLLLHAYMTLVQVPPLIRTNKLHEAEALLEASRKVVLGLWPDTLIAAAIRESEKP